MSRKKGKDNLTPGTPAWNKRQTIWRHNGLRGSVLMAQSNMQSITTAQTTTYESRQLATEIWNKLNLLAESLKTRRPFP